MRAALTAAPDLVIYRQWVDAVGLGYGVTDQGSLTLGAYEGPLDLAHARALS
jgi:hypothetical protein